MSLLIECLSVIFSRDDYVELLLQSLEKNIRPQDVNKLLRGIIKISEKKFSQEVKVVTANHGAFGLSPAAKDLLLKLQPDFDIDEISREPIQDIIPRTNPNLVYTIEKLADGANDAFSDFNIEEMTIYPGSTDRVHVYDGMETIVAVDFQDYPTRELNPQADAIFNELNLDNYKPVRRYTRH